MCFKKKDRKGVVGCSDCILMQSIDGADNDRDMCVKKKTQCWQSDEELCTKATLVHDKIVSIS